MTGPHLNHRKAAAMLALATIFWGLSFPVMKALSIVVQNDVPGAGSWFITGNTILIRFGLSALVILAFSLKTLRQFTFLEFWQGAGIGFFAAAGLVFQMDGLSYTHASTSAFLTQGYCVLLPFIVAVRDRQFPSPWLLFCCALLIAGVAILANIDWKTFTLGRGEWETLVGSLFFTGQILWLERPMFRENRVAHFTLVMFVTMALFGLPVALWNKPSGAGLFTMLQFPMAAMLIGLLVGFCTLIAFTMMNRWQPGVSAPEAGLIYAAEPVFATLFALFLPAWFSKMGGFEYANETLGWSFLAGAGLIVGANVLLQVQMFFLSKKTPLPRETR